MHKYHYWSLACRLFARPTGVFDFMWSNSSSAVQQSVYREAGCRKAGAEEFDSSHPVLQCRC